MEKITVIVPCYNEEAALHYYYKEMSRVMDEMNDVDFELLFINDGSKDKTLEIMMELANKDSRVKYISFSRNFGKEAAMYAGFENSTGDYVCLMDADLQDPPRLLPEMLKAIREEGYDSAATRRVTRKGEPPIRSFFARMFYKIMNKISDTELMDGARDYRLMTRQFVNALLELKEYDEANREFISLHNRIKGVNFYEVLYKTNATVGKVKEANAYLLYEFFENGYALEQLPLYQRLNEAVENSGNELLVKVVHSFIKALCNENQKDCDFVIDEKYQDKDSSTLYDEMYDLIMSHLDSLVTRKSGKVVYYNEQNQFGNISVYDHDPIFFRQADFAYDEEVERNIRVNYTVLPTYDSKKQRLTEKAILVTIDDSDYDFINR